MKDLELLENIIELSTKGEGLKLNCYCYYPHDNLTDAEMKRLLKMKVDDYEIWNEPLKSKICINRTGVKLPINDRLTLRLSTEKKTQIKYVALMAGKTANEILLESFELYLKQTESNNDKSPSLIKPFYEDAWRR